MVQTLSISDISCPNAPHLRMIHWSLVSATYATTKSPDISSSDLSYKTMGKFLLH